MKTVFLVPLAALLLTTGSYAQERIYRCGNEYTNTVTEEQAKKCKLVSGGNVTVVQSQRPRPASNTPTTPKSVSRVESGDQRSKDSDARLILESELKKAEVRQAELLKEYNNGQPEKLGPEHRNYQKYLDRVDELKASIARNESDIAGIRRELARVSGGASSSAAN